MIYGRDDSQIVSTMIANKLDIYEKIWENNKAVFN